MFKRLLMMLQETSSMVSTSSTQSRDALLSARDLLFSHRYGEAIVAFERLINMGDRALHNTLGEAYLCDRQYKKAAAAFVEANRVADEDDRPRIEHMGKDPAKNRTGHHLDRLGTAYWLAGEHDQAKATWRSYIEGNLAGLIIYGDAAGGVTQGLLLWYAGLLSRDEVTCKDALKYLTNRAKRSAIASWPGPLALMILGKKSSAEILAESFETDKIDAAIAFAKTDLLKRRHLARYLFYTGALALSQGKEDEYWQCVEQCAALENPIIENEWYIARGAVEQQQSL
jgi:hypothetical protein